MPINIYDSNVFYIFAVYKLLNECILPILNKQYGNEKLSFIIAAEDRNIASSNLKDLEKFLKTIFCLEGYDFNVTYYDSSTNYGIQLADLIVNTLYNKYRDFEIVKDVIPIIEPKKFILK